MNKKEIAEIKKQFTQERCAITRICGCYVDGEKNKKTELKEAFLSLPEEEMFKYFAIFRKALSGTVGKNLLTMEFPLASEEAGGTQDFLMQLRASSLKDENLLEEFYDKIIENYYSVENYLILLIHAVYDIPGKSSDGEEMFDASDEVYDHILCCICPVTLSKPGLSYDEESNAFHTRICDRVVNMPDIGFLFPAFHDRSTDVHSLLYYAAKPEELRMEFVEPVLGCNLPLSAGDQKETFQTIVEETLGDACDYEVVKNIHEKLNEMIEEKKDEPDPVVLDRAEVKRLLEYSGVEEEKLSSFEEKYEEAAGTDTCFVASNVANTRQFEIKTPDVVVKVSPDRMDLVETKVINGRKCLVISLDNSVEVNGITVRMGLSGEEEEEE
ncbi:MAG: DUF4317 domain-containing protein [Lachnospiraceae bacterium]|jgi:hypothetical protein|nr:DUF4317 domain-containing protein [Lachnospiraceae bacterium]MED9807055.1 DUF4317 domain-containing protein [Lachnospiraceae bacterium]MEE0398605.1 DUF4317 domain-containing protein [Lachnospiraceae bacterium]CDA68364.1 putative uncharacterized protein [Clostridium sp. CAG:510]